MQLEELREFNTTVRAPKEIENKFIDKDKHQ